MKIRLKQILVVALVGLLAAGAWFGFGKARPAPEVTVTRIDGQPLNSTSLRGKVVLINFWATTCTTCVKEMPRLVETWKQYTPRGYEMLALAMSYDNPDWVRDFARRTELPVIVALDSTGEAATAYGDVRLTPTSFLIDRKGNIAAQYLGEPDWDELHQRIERLLAEPA
ncbi:TlpA family protein disulfide reductase [Niveibacterium sp. 24ML]|uniref:TlpA family protein disulfide reductase n=1 Tax=Niveibacterium sp. 24ML TaxID=2985512 RepID=UPI00226E8E3B|nr:TlpA disulfide reductase family protein [Niveibacterium sp. 24ML]MCX9155375.1 TlpA family protein disulfide reductase [Niveibacterium sp. 24ML]